jgi:hypothetical protein
VGENYVSLLQCPAKVWTEDERRAVLDQLERMLANPHFSHSKRYPALFRYVVERALAGKGDQIKERTLGVEVFGRTPDYDTNQDPVVRTAAGEIRKRIAQYYHEPGRRDELRIELPPGTYVPEFHIPEQPPAATAVVAVAPVVVAAPAAPARSPWLRPAWFLPPVIALAVMVAILAAMSKLWTPHTALDRFWAPVFESSSPALLCVGQPHFSSLPGTALPPGSPIPAPSAESRTDDAPLSVESQVSLQDLYRMGKHYIALWDSVTVTRIAAFLEGRSKPYRIRGEGSTSLSDLRDGPAILVGAFNNNWTMRLTGPLRFSFSNPRSHVYTIQDRANPSQNAWVLDTSVPYMKQADDYAVISRIRDSTTGRFVVAAGGLAHWGTIAAGEFLTDPKYMEEIAKTAPPDWERKNIQVVIGTKVIAGNCGPPRVIATYFW